MSTLAYRTAGPGIVTRSSPYADVIGLPADRAFNDPDGLCLSAAEVRLDNTEFAAAVTATAHVLCDEHSIGRGSIVGVLAATVPEAITTMFAAWSLGAALTPVDPRLTDAQAAFQLTDFRCTVLVGGARAEALVVGTRCEFLSLDHRCFRGESDAEVRRRPRSRADDPALIVYGSGTPGRSKGCVLVHANITAMVRSLLGGLDFGSAARSLLALPGVDCASLIAGALAPLMLGGSVHMLPRADPTEFWDVVEAERPTCLSAQPGFLSALESQTGRADAHSLRLVLCASAPESRAALSRFESRFAIDVVEGWGPPECSVWATLHRPTAVGAPGAVGQALPGVRIEVMGGDDRILPPGQVGEVVIDGPTVMLGYFGNPEATGEVLRDGWLHTGDRGHLDADGCLILAERTGRV